MYKPDWQIYFNNTVAFIIFLILRIFFKKNGKRSNKVLFINTGQIGDLMVSSIIFTNQELICKSYEPYFLIKEKYKGIFQDYNGPVKLLFWDYPKYKYNIVYRIKFLLSINNIGFDRCIHLTAARGIINDELALLSGANEVVCLNNNWKYLKKLFGKRMDSYYDKIFSFDTINEHIRHVKILEHDFGKEIRQHTAIYIGSSTEESALMKLGSVLSPELPQKIVAIAPMSDEIFRNWGTEKFAELCTLIVKRYQYYIVLLGTNEQRETIESIAQNDRKHIFNLAGKLSVLESASIVKIADLFIGNDSGFTHIAKALKKNYIGIIGGGCYGIFFPYNMAKHDNLFFHELECFGCEWRCIYDTPYCISEVTVDQVYQRVEQILG